MASRTGRPKLTKHRKSIVSGMKKDMHLAKGKGANRNGIKKKK
jgi:hypothetical protein